MMSATRDHLTVPPYPYIHHSPQIPFRSLSRPTNTFSKHSLQPSLLNKRSFQTILLCAGTDIDIRTWFQNVEQHATEGVHKILIGNKCDWNEKRVVSEEQGRALARELGVPFMETSAKANINVEDAFFSLARYAFALLTPFTPFSYVRSTALLYPYLLFLSIFYPMF